MPQYLMSVHHDEADLERMSAMSEADMQAMFSAVGEFNDKLQADGAWVFAGGLEPIGAATTVDASRDHASAPVVTDGPFAESKEYLGGFWIIEAADLDAALAWATAGSTACGGPVEVRPFQEG